MPQTKDTWNFSDLVSQNPQNDIQNAKENYKTFYTNFRNTYKGRVKDLSMQEWKELYQSFEAPMQEMYRIGAYLSYRLALDVNDAQALTWKADFVETLTEGENQIAFWNDEMKSLTDEHFQTLLSAPELSEYRHSIEQFYKEKKHLLPENEEILINKLGLAGAGRMQDLHDKLLSNQTFGKNGKDTMETLLGHIRSQDRDTRIKAVQTLAGRFDELKYLFVEIFNTMLTDKKTKDELRGFPHWLASRNLDNEISDESVNSLIEVVQESYSDVGQYYETKRKILGYDTLYEYDRYAPLPFHISQNYTYEEAKKLVLETFQSFDPKFYEIAKKIFEKGHVDSHPKAGKTGGAFCSYPSNQITPYVLLNFTGDFRDVSTMAHEFGHAIHGEIARAQNMHNFGFPLTLAETASILCETILFETMYQKMDDPKEKLMLLGATIDDSIAAIQRQTAMNRFENQIHTHRRTQGELTGEDFDTYWRQTQYAMFDGKIELSDEYRHFWTYISHFVEMPGYVYAYSFGSLLSFALVAKYKAGEKNFQENIKQVLRSSGSQDPQKLLYETFGIDLSQKSFWEEGMNILREYMQDYNKLAKEL